MRRKLRVVGLCFGLCMLVNFWAEAQDLADTTQLSSLGTWPTAALSDSSFVTATIVSNSEDQPASSNKLKAFVETNTKATPAINHETTREIFKRLNFTIKLDPKNAEVYVERGKLKYQLNQNAAAIKDFTIAISLAPAATETYYHRGLASLKAKDYIGAVEDLTKRLDTEPSVAGFIARAKAKAYLLDYRGAIEDNNKALAMEEENEEALYNRAAANFFLREYYKAIADFTTLLELNTNLAETYYFRGLARHKTNDIDGGCLDLSRAGELGFEGAYEAIKKLCR